ncbi:hypothetical protein ACFQZW_12875 [Lutibacter aestuarii]|uniref:Uncharacterized protein n=1 Tax=Lutibacter aestuarii TaxID=861111 RepID=A0ABW2Z843_9FLAO
MSKPNTLHIIGFSVKQHTVIAPPVVIDAEEKESYAFKGYVTEDYWV